MILRHAFIPLDNARLAHLCGSLDAHLRGIEETLEVSITRRNESFRIEGAKVAAERAVLLLQALYDSARKPIAAEAFQLALGQAAVAQCRHTSSSFTITRFVCGSSPET